MLSGKQIKQEPCPICRSLVPVEFLNAHVNDHLDNDPFKEEEIKLSDEPHEEPPFPADIDHPDADDNGFEVICPYPTCGKLVQMKLLPKHVYSTHLQETNHDYACPICSLLGYEMTTDKQLNLLVHLRRKHDKPEYNIQQQTILHAATIHKDGADNDDDDGKDTIDNFGGDDFAFLEKVAEEEVTEEDIKPVEKTWEEKEEEIVKNTVHVVLEKDLDESDSCIFCLGGFKKGQKVAILGCLCKFCEECFNDYMASNPKNACPVHHKY